jgi:hypothetical protein
MLSTKREGISFDLPSGTRTGVHAIEHLVSGDSGKALREALEQVAGYAASNGVAPAGVVNGHQLVVFLAVRTDGVPPLKGRALVFPGLAEMLSDFRLLWDNLSPSGIDQKVLYRTLRLREAPPPEPLSIHLATYPGSKRRNSLQSGLDILGELFLEDVARLEELRSDFLRDCYASSGALSQYAEVSKQILRARYALLQQEDGPDVASAEGRKGLSPHLTQDMLAAAVARRPIVLLGDVGVGKTTFIQRLVHVDAADLFGQAICLYIDYGASSTIGGLDSFVVEESIRQLREKYAIDIEEMDFATAVHHGALNRFDKGVVGALRGIDPPAYARERLNFLRRIIEDRPIHLKASLEHIRASMRKQAVIFLDNIDQRSSADQEQVFLIANELAQTWPATVFVTLRPETFYRSSRSGTLSGYQARVFTIAPPRADLMLQRRVDFALHQLRSAGRLGSFPAGVTVDSDSLIAFLEILAQNFRSNTDLLALIDNLAGGNMRLALQFVTSFIGSGHIDTEKMLRLYEEGGRYTIPLHEFLRALLFGDGVYYDPSASPIANLFRISHPDGREHFLLPLLLTQAQSLGERVGDEGYVAAADLFDFAQSLGFSAEQVTEALDHALNKRLLDAAPRHSGDVPRLHYRITTVGAYTTRVLVAYFSYVDAVLVDTPIVDKQYRQVIKDIHSLTDRVSRSEYFRLYLDRQWSRMDETGLPWSWTQASERLARDIRRVGVHADPDAWR